jgi:peptide/nickel transport system substrate-binding protein
MQRRRFVTGATTLLAMPAIARGAAAQVLKFVPQADLAVLDPIWTTTYQTRDHGFLVFDTLFGLDAAFNPQPQMAEGALAEDDGKRWRITLRPGLVFHDGTKVLARDCAASIRRWGARDGFGQALLAAIDEITAPDDKSLELRLKYRFPMLPAAFAKTPPSMCPIMPERLALTDPYKQVSEMVGSGPYRYKADERVAGSLVVYERNAAYVPRPNGTPSGTAGPKMAYLERIEWHIIPDGSTVAAALQRGEVDWWLTPVADLLPMLQKVPTLKTEIIVPTGLIATMRLNHLTPPFNNPAIRRAMLGGVLQSDYMIGMVGTDEALWHVPCGAFCPDTPLASTAGLDALTSKRDLAKVKRELAAAGYAGEKVVLLAPTDIASAKALADISADWMHQAGLNVDYQAMDWATVVQRRAKMDPVEQGGWSIFHTSWTGLDQINPAGHIFLRGNGRAAAPGWPDSPRLEALRADWFRAEDTAAQKQLAEQMQLQMFQDVPYVPLGQYFAPTTYQRNLTGLLPGNPVFWNIRRA